MFTLRKLRALFRIVLAELRAAAFLSFQSRERHRFGNGQQILQIERGVPAGIEFAISRHADPCRRVPRVPQAFQRRAAFRSSCRTMPTLSCIISCKSFCTW